MALASLQKTVSFGRTLAMYATFLDIWTFRSAPKKFRFHHGKNSPSPHSSPPSGTSKTAAPHGIGPFFGVAPMAPWFSTLRNRSHGIPASIFGESSLNGLSRYGPDRTDPPRYLGYAYFLAPHGETETEPAVVLITLRRYRGKSVATGNPIRISRDISRGTRSARQRPTRPQCYRGVFVRPYGMAMAHPEAGLLTRAESSHHARSRIIPTEPSSHRQKLDLSAGFLFPGRIL